MLARRIGSYQSAFCTDYGKSADFRNRLAQAVISSKRRIVFEDRPGISLADLQQIIVSHVMRSGIQGFILDYWQLVGGKPKNKSTQSTWTRWRSGWLAPAGNTASGVW
jgi:hypothetical protein